MRLLATAVLLVATAGAQSELMSLLDDGHYKRARAIAEARLKQNPKDAEALYAMARVRQAYNDLEGAHSFAERAVAADGSKATYHCLLGQTSGNKAQKAGVFSKFGLGRAVKKEGEAGLQLDAKQSDCYHLLIAFHLQAPGMIGGDPKKAQELADKLMTIDPVEGYYAQARIAQHNKQTDKLNDLYIKAAQANPRSYKANLTVAGIYGGQKKFDLAEKHAREALKAEPNRHGAFSVLAQLLVAQDKWTELDGLLAQAEKAAPENLNPYFQAGRVALIENKELPRAERYFRKYLTQEPEGGAPSKAAAHWRLGLVLEKQGKKDQARQEIRTAVALDPAFEPAKKDLERLK